MSDSSASQPARWTGFYLEHRASLLAYASALCGNLADAQDLLQDVLVRLAGRAEVVPERGYVLRCLRNGAIDRRRRRSTRPDRAELVVDPAVVVDAVALERSEAGGQVRRALERVSEPYREVLVLRVFCELPFREISTLLDLPLGTVTSHYRRGLDELRQLLVEYVEHVC